MTMEKWLRLLYGSLLQLFSNNPEAKQYKDESAGLTEPCLGWTPHAKHKNTKYCASLCLHWRKGSNVVLNSAVTITEAEASVANYLVSSLYVLTLMGVFVV